MRAKKARQPKLRKTSVRDFSGGWNVIDNELNLSAKYSKIFDNVTRAPDGSVSPRFGYELFSDLRDGVVTSGTAGFTIETTISTTLIEITWTGHGFQSGDHITFIDIVDAVGGVPASELNGTHGIVRIDANTFSFHQRVEATSNDTDMVGGRAYVHDTHTLAGDLIDGVYFQDYLIVIDDIGEIARIDRDGVATRIWSWEHSEDLAGSPAPWRNCVFVSYDTFKSKLIIANDRDKPLEVDTDITPEVSFLVDPATASNADIPVAKLVKACAGYVTMVESASPGILRISAKNTSGVFVGNIAPDDAVDIDLTQITSVVNPQIMAINTFREKLFMAFQNASMIASLGIYNGTVHEPLFSDVMARHGTISHRTVVSLGNDILMCDYAGVPSVTISSQSGAVVPDRVSQLIEPALQKNIARLDSLTLEQEAFAIWAPRDRQYMLFMPKYTLTDSRPLTTDPIYATDETIGNSYLMLQHVGHGFEEGDYLLISGASGAIGGISNVDINGIRRIRHVVDENYVLIEVGATVTAGGQQGGGSSITISPVYDETIGYIFTYNPQLKIKAWSRFRGLQARWATTSLFGRLFFGWEGKVYRLGSTDDPVYVDRQEDYDIYRWDNSTAYAEGLIVRDDTDGTVWECMVDHTSEASGTFEEDRDNTADRWVAYEGEPITWVWEMPWADFDNRMDVKSLRHVSIDTKGNSRFTFSMFADNIYENRLTLDLSPARVMEFVGGDTGGFGLGDQPFGGGRRTKEEFLWSVPLKAKLVKLRFEGQTTEPIRIVAVNLTYHVGAIQR